MIFTGDNSLIVSRELFSDKEKDGLMRRLWQLLATHAYKYTGIDSTSISVEKAQDILESLLYTIEISIEEGATREEILFGELSEFVDRGQTILKERIELVGVEWKLLCQELPKIQNVYYNSTIMNIGQFFKNYNIYYESHRIPCSIDYWPLCPVPENNRGITYIAEYIRRIQIENDFLNFFDPEKVVRVYKRFIPDYPEMLFNLCEPVLCNALGLCILDSEPDELNFTPEQIRKLYDMMDDRSNDEIQNILEHSLENMLKKMGMEEEETISYFTRAISGMALRVREAVLNRNLSKVFTF